MSKDIVIAFWVEADTAELCSKSLGANDIFRGGTYRSEVILKCARNPLDFDIVEIPIGELGSAWAESEIQRLKEKSAALLAAANDQPLP